MASYAHIAHGDFVELVRTLVDQLEADDWMPAFVVGVGRGGLVPAVFLSHAIQRPMFSVDWSSGVEAMAGAALVEVARHSREGERLLLVDDINDSGRTVAALRAGLATAEAAADSVRFATLIDNVRSAERVHYRARSIDRQVNKDWFVFPWEAVAPTEAVEAEAAVVPERLA